MNSNDSFDSEHDDHLVRSNSNPSTVITQGTANSNQDQKLIRNGKHGGSKQYFNTGGTNQYDSGGREKTSLKGNNLGSSYREEASDDDSTVDKGDVSSSEGEYQEDLEVEPQSTNNTNNNIPQSTSTAPPKGARSPDRDLGYMDRMSHDESPQPEKTFQESHVAGKVNDIHNSDEDNADSDNERTPAVSPDLGYMERMSVAVDD